MQRVMIVGGPGSGKSTLALMMGAVIKLPVYHMDHIHWKPHWVERTVAEKEPLVAAIHASDTWIFEGGYSRTYPERLARADTFIWLDMGITLCMWRIMRRNLLDLGRTRPDMTENCPEHLGRESFKFWRWTWDTRHDQRRKHLKIVNSPPAHLAVYHLTSMREIRHYMRGLERECTQ